MLQKGERGRECILTSVGALRLPRLLAYFSKHLLKHISCELSVSRYSLIKKLAGAHGFIAYIDNKLTVVLGHPAPVGSQR